MKILKIILIVLLVIILLAGVGIFTCYMITKDVKLDIAKLESRQTNIKLLDDKGSEISIKNNIYTPISMISDDIRETFVAVEDKRFYEHSGIDTKRILSASVKNIFSWSFKEGASTLTQQLIKNTHFSSEKTITRKLSEIKLALEIERKYTKDQILEMYLNVVYFGSGIYGIHDACLAYFNKLPLDINLSEACMIAGVVKNPNKNSPISNLDGALARQSVVFKILENQAKISESTLNNAKLYNIVINNGLKENSFSHSYIKNALDESCNLLGINEADLVRDGYIIKTYFDSKTQEFMYNKAINNSDINDKYYTYSTLNNTNLGVSTYVSNVPLLDHQIKRQAGSTIKPLSTYLPAFEKRIISPLYPVLDEKIDINGYSPNNYNGVFHGYVSISDSIIHSYNIPAVKILERVGIDYSADFLSKIGINISDIEKNLSLALGSNSVSPLDIAGAYASIANYGKYQKSHFVSSIIDSKGNTVYNEKNINSTAFNENDAFMMTDILLKTSKHGTGSKLNNLNYDIASKTGTVSAGKGVNSDGWCVAYTTEHTMLAWHGAMQNEVLDNKHSGSNYPTIMVREMANCIYTDNNPPAFTPTSEVIICDINKKELEDNHIILRQNEGTIDDIVKSYFYKDNLPEYYSDTDISIPFIVSKNGRHNKIEFLCESGCIYEVYKTDLFGNVKLVRRITANGDKICIVDANSILYKTDNYHVMKADIDI